MRAVGCQLPLFVSFVPEATYFFYKVALSILEPTVRLLIYSGVCIDVASNYINANNTIENITDTSLCRATLEPYPDLEDRVQSEAADYMILSKVLMNVPAIILGFFCGGWSDIVGRRMPMFLTCAGSCLAVIFYILSLVVGGAAIPFVLFATFVHSVFGRNSVITMAVHSSVTDLTTREERTKRLGRLLAMNFLGQFCGSLMLGVLLDRVGFLAILIVVFFLFGFCCVFVSFFLPETVHNAPPLLSSPLTLAESSKELCQLHHIRDSVLVVARPRINRLRLYLIICLVCLCVNQTCKAGEVDVTLLYVRHRPLEWEKSEYGYLLAVNFAAIGLCLLFVLPVLSDRLAIRDTTIIIGVVCFKVLRLFIMAFARHDWLVYLSTLLDSPIGMVISCLKSIISKITDESETGKAFAIQASIETASGMFGAMFFNSLYDVSFRYFIGTTFIVEAVIYLLLLGIAIWMWKTLDAHTIKTDYDKINSENEETAILKQHDENGYYGGDSGSVMAMSDVGGNGQVVINHKASDYGTATGAGVPSHWNNTAESYSNSAASYTEQPINAPIAWSSTYQQPELAVDNSNNGSRGVRVQQAPYNRSYSISSNNNNNINYDNTVISNDYQEISAPPPPPVRSQRPTGESPPAAIARPRPAANRRQNQQPQLHISDEFADNNNNNNNNNNINSNDQFGALTQYR